MKILLLGDINSIHIKKWAAALAGSGIEIGIFGLGKATEEWYQDIEYVSNCNEAGFSKSIFDSSLISKINYLNLLPKLKKAIKSFQPDIVHVHYASSYGLLGKLSGFHPIFVSVWGSDVYVFPNKGKLQNIVLKSNLKNADKIFSTSRDMKKETEKYTDKDIKVIPFGIDIENFKHMSVEREFAQEDIVLGTIKSLEKEYAIDVLIKAFSIVCDRNPQLQLKLMICGEGSLRNDLEALCNKLGIVDRTTFTGLVAHDEVPRYLNMIDVFGCLSDNESFGVAVAEAMACELPVVVSDVGGLPELVENGRSGSVVPPQSPVLAADAIEIFVLHPLVREKIGHNARLRIKTKFNWANNVQDTVNSYLSNARSTS
ncbi:MAG: glycosyl transferase family 1 [Bacteroidetes bacterium]|nr:MAG: glycosyl transferase family 1 [Bacteroidota bacterium]